jgi:hypothetical protein
MNTIECYKCNICNNLLPKDSVDYIVIEQLKLVSHEMSRDWDKKSYWNKTAIELNPETRRVFCTSICFKNYIDKALE